MPKRYIRFNLKPATPLGLQMGDSRCDFILIMERRIFALHSQLLQPSEYLRSVVAQNRKTVAIDSHINAECLQQILGCFYGVEACFERHNIVTQLLEILSLLRVQEFNEQLTDDMHLNFDEYGLFNVFYLSRMLGLKDIEDRCISELIHQEFEQINYNKYDLLQLSPELFTFVLKQHQKMKALHSITGFHSAQIKAVCEQYMKTTNENVNVDEILEHGKQFQRQQDFSEQQDQGSPCIRRRNATWTNTPQREMTVSVVKVQQKNSQSQTVISKISDRSQEQMAKIKQINSAISEKYHVLQAQIKKVQRKLTQNQSHENVRLIDDLDKKKKDFQHNSLLLEKKFTDLKLRMVKMSKQNEKYAQEMTSSPVNLKRQESKQSRSDKSEKAQNKMLGFAVLHRIQDIESDLDCQV